MLGAIMMDINYLHISARVTAPVYYFSIVLYGKMKKSE